MSFAIRNIETGEVWTSYTGKTAWARGSGAKQAWAACNATRLDDCTTHELVDLTMAKVLPYRDALANLVAAIGMSGLDYRKLETLNNALLVAKELLEPTEKI